MYIIKNALRCIGRSMSRNLLIGIIALVIALSACIGLSIRQAADSAKESALEGMSVTGTISYDRSGAMNEIGGGRPSGEGGGNFNKDAFKDMMGGASSLTIDEYLIYAEADSVKDFYYTLTAYLNGSDDFSPVSDESSESGGVAGVFTPPGGMGGMGGFGGGVGGDFSIIGYSSYNAMTSFVEGTASILEGGTMFAEETSDFVCVISEDLANYNNYLEVGDTVVLTNPSAEGETYTLEIVGIYTSSENNDFSMSIFGTSMDPVNQILVNANTLQAILDASAEVSTTITDEYNRETETKINGTLSATYVFADTDDYYRFEDEVRTLGLDDSYTVSSPDINAFEERLTPLRTLGTMAGWFLLVILIIGGVILVVLNIFNVRERKYEVGVLTAMGMKKWKVAAQFMCEILVVTMVAVVIGATIGAVCSVPVTNALLEGQIESQNQQQNQMNENFGFPDGMGSGFGGGNTPPDMPDNVGGKKNPFGNMLGGAADYITEVNSAMNLTVVFQMIGVGLLLTLIASAASVLFIMRYDPLKILANRD